MSDMPPSGRHIELLLRGKVSLECPPTAKIVRIFTSSTFTDTSHERNHLMEKTYPKLKEFCQSLGYEFQVVDMRWGVRDEATDDHMTTELCLREVDLCNKLSTGPSFVTFLSHKYGFRPIPRVIPASEYEMIFACITSIEIQAVVSGWYLKDENSDPPSYLLQPITSILPDFNSDNDDKKTKSRKAWYDQFDIIRQALMKAAKQILDPDSAHKYLRSVTEAEIDRGIQHGGKRAFWFDRHIVDIEKQQPNKLLSSYKECGGKDDEEADQLLKRLRAELYHSRLPRDNIRRYTINWTNKGIDPISEKTHKSYIEELAGDFEQDIKNCVLKAINEKQINSINTPFNQEIFQHLAFCQEKCKTFYGRKDTLQLVETYVQSDSNEPLIIHGPSGSGKTSIVAMAAKNSWSETPENMIIIIRILGTTVDSCNIGALLKSVINQIRIVYNQEPIVNELEPSNMATEFINTLEFATLYRPLLIILDSLDQLNISDQARQLFWMPKQLPKYVKMIVSTLPEVEYECFPILKSMFKDPSSFLPVATLSNNDVEVILEKWLESKQRKFQDLQLKILLKAFKQCPLPLFLKLSFDEACRWKSYTSPDLCVLKSTIRKIITDLFIRVETLHGRKLVEKSLGYLTLSSSGLTEAELEDILSCDDDVLNDVYQYWTPPVRRLPPLLLIRIKAELGQYFVDRGADGVRVFYWYHRQFIEAATDRYCSNDNIKQKIQGVLADFFTGTWANGKQKPYTSKSGENLAADRYVASQPIKLGKSFNLRKLNNLPHHRLLANQQDLLKSECLCNFDFILNKLKASGFRPLLEDFSSAKETYPLDEDIKLTCEALQLSQHSLQNPHELPSQLLGRLPPIEGIKQLLSDCRNAPFNYFLPNTPLLAAVGGPLLHSLSDHNEFVLITGLDVSDNGEFAATSDNNGAVKTFSVTTGQFIRSFETGIDVILKIQFCNFDKSLLLEALHRRLIAIDYQTGVQQYILDCGYNVNYCLCNDSKDTCGIFVGKSVHLYNTAKGSLLRVVECNLNTDDVAFTNTGCCYGQGRYMVATDKQKHFIILFDIKKNEFMPITKMKTTIVSVIITADEKYVAIATNDRIIHLFDMISMKKVKELKVSDDRGYSIHKFSGTRDGKYLCFPVGNEIVVLDCETGDEVTAIYHPCQLIDVVALNMRTFVTSGRDSIVRIWDRSKINDTKLSEEDGKERTEVVIYVLDNPRYVLTKYEENDCFFLGVFDLSTNENVKTEKLLADYDVIPVDGSRVLLYSEERIVLFDLSSSTIIQAFSGDISLKKKVMLSATGFIVLSADEMKIKIYNTATEACHTVECCGHVINEMFVNDGASVLAAYLSEDKNVALFDLKNRAMMYIYKSEMLGDLPNADGTIHGDLLITNDGKYLIHFYRMAPPCLKDTDSELSLYKLSLNIVWDIQARKLHTILYDEEYSKKYLIEELDWKQLVKGYQLLDDTTLISSHEDGIIRIYDIHTGCLKHRIITGNPYETKLVISKNTPFFISYEFVGVNRLTLFDKNTFHVLATYSFDSMAYICHLKFATDGFHLVASRDVQLPFVCAIKGGETNSNHTSTKELSQYDETFTKTDTIKELSLEDVN